MKSTYIVIIISLSLLSGCVFPNVYKIDIQQGNIVTQEMLNQLKEGMNQRQVLYIMGTPALTNPYKKKRWDYIYTLEQDDKLTSRYLISLFFDENFRYAKYTGELPPKKAKDKQ